MGRILAVDWGSRRIGLALSDETQTLAQPLTTLTRRAGKRVPMAQLMEQVNRHQVVGIIVGLPLDERMTTARALAAVREMGGTTRGRKEDVDAMAAALLLQHYLDSKKGTAL